MEPTYWTLEKYEEAFAVMREILEVADPEKIQKLEDLYQESNMDIRGVKMQKELGRGASGQVYRITTYCEDSRMKGEYALKTMPLSERVLQNKRIHQEVAVLKKLNHPNIIKIYDDFIAKRKLNILGVSSLGFENPLAQ